MLLLQLLLAAPALPREEVELVRVVDGDTLRVKLPDGKEAKVRLIGIDTPEVRTGERLTEQAKKLGMDEQRLLEVGEQASRRARELVTGQRLFLEYDADLKDRYGRTLAYVWVGEEGPTLNERLVAEGLATLEPVPPNVRHETLLQSQFQAARKAGVGLWKAPTTVVEEVSKDEEGVPGWVWGALVLVPAAALGALALLSRDRTPPDDEPRI